MDLRTEAREACDADSSAERHARQTAVLSFVRAVRANRVAAVNTLRPLLEHADASVRAAAHKAIEVLEKDHTVLISNLAAQLERGDERTRNAALDSLRRIATYNDTSML